MSRRGRHRQGGQPRTWRRRGEAGCAGTPEERRIRGLLRRVHASGVHHVLQGQRRYRAKVDLTCRCCGFVFDPVNGSEAVSGLAEESLPRLRIKIRNGRIFRA